MTGEHATRGDSVLYRAHNGVPGLYADKAVSSAVERCGNVGVSGGVSTQHGVCRLTRQFIYQYNIRRIRRVVCGIGITE